MSTKKILVAAICLTLHFAAGAQSVSARGGAVASGSDGSRRLVSGHQRRAARRRTKKKMSRQTTAGVVQQGIWGGVHVRMMVREGGAALEFDCARGEIGETLKTDAEGRFDLPGTLTRESPGPIRLDIKPVARPARYAGRVEGRTMTLSLTITDTDRETQTFTLTRGSEGRLWKCR
jgi:hypothetical protein